MGERHIFYIKINTGILFRQQTDIIRSLFISSKSSNDLKTLAYTLSHKEGRIGKLKTLIVTQNHQRTVPPKGRTTIRLPPLPLVFFFLLILRKTFFINLNQNQTLRLRRSRQKLHIKKQSAGRQSLKEITKLLVRQIITSFRQENRAKVQIRRKLRRFKIQRINRIIILKRTVRFFLTKGNQITSIRKRIISNQHRNNRIFNRTRRLQHVFINNIRRHNK
nr:MAG TPA: hypothetical protein [Microviridae sp.]